MTFDETGNLYWSDVHDGIIRKLAPDGSVSTFAQLTAVAGVSVDPTGRWLAAASIENGIVRYDLAGGPGEQIGGPPSAHGVAYDATGSLWISDPGSGLYRLTTTLTRIGTIRPGHLPRRRAGSISPAAHRPAAASGRSILRPAKRRLSPAPAALARTATACALRRRR